MTAGKRLTLIFEGLQNLYLVKDMGQIPYLLQRDFGFSSTIACRKPDEPFDYLADEVQGLQIDYINGSPYQYLIQKAAEIDVLMLFYICSRSLQLGILYKLLNPGGFLYLKPDMEGDRILFATWGARNFITQARRNLLFWLFLKKVDLLSFESSLTYRGVSNVPSDLTMHLPNGFDVMAPERMGIPVRSFVEKEKLILLVASHGTKVKNSELLFNVLEILEDLPGWQVAFVGPFTEEFRICHERFTTRYQAWRGRIHLVGNVTNRRELMTWYSRARIFCLPSRSESWGLVAGEALCYGCTLLISRELSSSADLTDSGRAGLLASCDDAAEWATLLGRLAADPELLEEFSHKGRKHFLDNLAWQINLKRWVDRFEKRKQITLNV